MNIVDWIILGVIAVSVIFGLYRGFIESLLGAGTCLGAFGLSFIVYPRVAGAVRGNESIIRTLEHYTDAASRIGDLDIATRSADMLSGQDVPMIVEKASLPAPFDRLLSTNLQTLSFGGGAATVSDYVSQTILNASINILSFAVCFIVLYIALQLVVNMISHIAQFPLLKQLDSLAGGAVGLLRGILILFVLFTLVPLVLTIVPVDLISGLIEGSTFAPFFNGGNLVMAIMNGRL